MFNENNLLFFDTEFTGLTQDTTLVSIGLVSLNLETKFYSEFDCFNHDQVDK